MRLISVICAILVLGICLSSSTYGQQTILKSSLDDLVAIKNVTVAPLVDNVSQIYAQPLTVQLRALIEEDRQWNLRTFPEGERYSPEDLEDNPDTVKKILSKNLSEALIAGRLAKGPQGITIKLDLFLAKDGYLFAQEQLSNYSGFEMSDLRREISTLYKQLRAKIPFSGTVLSRKGNQVTVDIGTQQGLTEGADISVIQILKFNRHPKHHFIVSSEKEIIGKIKISKVDTSLSFGTITLERSENLIQPLMKVDKVEFLEYKNPAVDPALSDIADRKDSHTLGESPKEWVPMANPQYGKIGLMLGLSNYAISNTINSSGAVNSSQFPAPSIGMDGELWLSNEWILDFSLKQYILTVSNSLSGSSPGTINVSTTQMNLLMGYNFLLSDSFFGPKFQILGGYSQLASQVDNSSPSAYTSMTFSGFALGVAGAMPVDDVTPLNIGAKLLYFLNANVNETPVTSGASSSAKISHFSVFGSYKWTERINWKGELAYDLYSASFSGTGTRGAQSASSASHTITNFSLGIEYLF